MRTVQSYLREADRKRLLDSFANDMLSGDIQLLLENKDRTISDLQETCRKNMDGFIDHLLSLDAAESDHMVLYLSEEKPFNGQRDKTLCLIDLNEIRKDIYASGYGFSMSGWNETLGFLVADNKLTQEDMTELLSQYLYEVSFFGIDPEEHRKELEEIHADLEEAAEEIKKGHTIPADEVFETIRKKHGLHEDEKDEIQEKLRAEIINAELRYSRYCNWRERKQILKSLGEEAPAYRDDPAIDRTASEEGTPPFEKE